MKFFVIVASLAALASARPEAPVYGAPNVGGTPIGGGGSFISGGHGGSFLGGGGGFGGGSFGGGGGGGGGFGGGSFGGGSSFTSSGGSFATGGGGGGGGGFTSGGFGGQAVVQKHIYVHVPPPEPEIVTPQRTYQSRTPQKHYKIVFIKAPSPPVPTAPIIPAFAQDEQKTLIYVLVKRPEEQPEINIPQPVPTAPSKPEVYFIRYKTAAKGGAIGIGDGGIGGAIGGGSIGGGSIGGGGIGGIISGIGGGIGGGIISGGGIGGGIISGGGIGGGHGGGGHGGGGHGGATGPSTSYGTPSTGGGGGPY